MKAAFDLAKIQDGDAELTEYFKMKLHMYLGTTEIVQALQRSFGVDMGTAPTPFGSTWHFIMEKSEAGAYQASVLYNKQPVKLPGACNDAETCGLDDFFSTLATLEYQGNIDEKCKDTSGLTEGTDSIVVTTSACAGVAMLVLGAFMMFGQKKGGAGRRVDIESLL